MSLTLQTAVKNAALDTIFDKLDDGAGAGYVTICESTTILATLTFSDPACATASGGSISFNSITADASAEATGTADTCRFYDSTGALKFTGTVSTSGADINLSTTSIVIGDAVSISSGSASF